MIRRPPRSTLFPSTTALPISPCDGAMRGLMERERQREHGRGGHADRGIGARRAAGHRLGQHRIGDGPRGETDAERSEEHTSELQSRLHLVCRLLLEKKKNEKHRVARGTEGVIERVYTADCRG